MGCYRGIRKQAKLDQHNAWRWLAVSSNGFQASLNAVLRRAVRLKLSLDSELAESVLPHSDTLAPR